jgi:hypothetical protein
MRQLIEISTDAQVEALIPNEGISGFILKSEQWESDIPGKVVRSSVRVNNDNLLLSLELEPFSTYRVMPISMLQIGTPLQLARYLGRQIVADAVITKSWLKSATRESWQNVPIPDSDRDTLEYSRSFTLQEYSRIQLGEVPYSMEDHWFAYFENNWLYWHRSWTGVGIFEVHIESVEDTYKVTEARVNKSQDAGIADIERLDGLLNGMCYEAKVFE